MHAVIQKVVVKLVSYPEAKYPVEEDAITIHPKDENGSRYRSL